jgi:hypothetical protein
MLTGLLGTVFGWNIHVGPNINPRTLRNFPMQANGAEMLRLACCLATERGINVCAPVHDALLIEAPLADLDAAVHLTQAAMAEASRIVLGGHELRSDAKVFRYPDRFSDERGMQMWNAVLDVLSGFNTNSSSLFIYVPAETPNTSDTSNSLDTLNTSDSPNTPDASEPADTRNL